MNYGDLNEVKDVVVHGSCPDGLASALICASAFSAIGKDPNIWFIQYQSVDHISITPKDKYLFVDITPHVNNWEIWKDFSPIVLDHHESAEHVVTGLQGIFGSVLESGASLAFDHVMEPIIREHGKAQSRVSRSMWQEVARLSAIRDTWQDSHPDWLDSCALVTSLNFFSNKYLLYSAKEQQFDLTEALRFGKILYKKTLDRSRLMADGADIRTTKCGHKIGFYNCSEKLYNEISHELIQRGNDMAVGFYYMSEGGETKIIASIRGSKSFMKVRPIAEALNGGGHDFAAGFHFAKASSKSPENIIQEVMDVLDRLYASKEE